MKNLKYIIACMAALTITASFSGCSDDDSKNSSGSEVVYYDDNNSYVEPGEAEAEAKANAVQIEGKLNEQVSVSVCELVVNDVTSIGVSHDDVSEMYAAKVSVTNNAKEAIDVSSIGDFTFVTDLSTEVFAGMDTYATSVAKKSIADFQLIDGQAEPGETVTGYITFTVEPNWNEMKISYTPRAEELNYDYVVYTITPDMVKK